MGLKTEKLQSPDATHSVGQPLPCPRSSLLSTLWPGSLSPSPSMPFSTGGSLGPSREEMESSYTFSLLPKTGLCWGWALCLIFEGLCPATDVHPGQSHLPTGKAEAWGG